MRQTNFVSALAFAIGFALFQLGELTYLSFWGPNSTTTHVSSSLFLVGMLVVLMFAALAGAGFGMGSGRRNGCHYWLSKILCPNRIHICDDHDRGDYAGEPCWDLTFWGRSGRLGLRGSVLDRIAC